MNDKTISLDFDGVIHRYSKGWQDESIYDEPVEGAFDVMHRLQSEGFRLVICTARPLKGIRLWFQTSGAADLADSVVISNVKIPAIAYIDDRAIRFTNWADIKKYFC